ncbi:MAG: hypothetical protein WA323_10930 [Candidatus Nitrosopolaris sp.]
MKVRPSQLVKLKFMQQEASKSNGNTVVLTTMHDGVTHNFTVILGEMPSPL